MPLHPGWWNVVSGFEAADYHTLYFDVEPDGRVRGEGAGRITQCRGFWDDIAQKITFFTSDAVYTGYRWTRGGAEYLAGTYVSFDPPARGGVAGWCASLDNPIDSFQAGISTSPGVSGLWQIVANGFEGQLRIPPIRDRSVTGTIYGDRITGVWDDRSGKLAFIRSPERAPSERQYYTGYSFTYGGHSCLAGFFEAFSGTGGNPARPLYGWQAVWTGE